MGKGAGCSEVPSFPRDNNTANYSIEVNFPIKHLKNQVELWGISEQLAYKARYLIMQALEDSAGLIYINI